MNTKKYALVFFLVMFLIGTDTFLVSPLLPTLSHLYHIPMTSSGWMVSAYAIGYALFALVSGPISDGRNRKKIMIVGLLAFAASTLLCSVSYCFELMILFRFLSGVSASFVTPQVWSSIPVVVPKDKIIQVMGYATAGLSISQLVGIPLGSYLAAASWHLPFLVISALSVILAAFVAKTLPSLKSNSKREVGMFAFYAMVLKNKLSTRYLLAYFVFQTGSFTCMTFIGVWFASSFGLTLTNIGTAMIAIGAGNLLGSLSGSKIVKRIGLSSAFLGELCLLVVLYLALIFAHTFALAVALLVAIFVVNGFIFPLFMATLQSTTTNARSTISSLSNAAMYFGQTLAGIVGGVLFQSTHDFSGIALFVVVMILMSMSLYAVSGIFKKNSGRV